MIFSTEGPENTQEAARAAVAAAAERKISHIVVASCTGRSARVLRQEADAAGYPGSLVCVTHAFGFAEKGRNEMSDAERSGLEGLGFRICTASHVLSGAERGMSRKFQGAYPVEIAAHTLRLFGQGVKVCVEASVMALDGGLIPYGTPVVALGGTMSGLDTAVVLSPAHAGALFDTRIHEILCKPS